MNLEALDFRNFGTADRSWFHPVVAPLPDGRLFAAMQKINGSDHYGSPMFSVSADLGRSWSAPAAAISPISCTACGRR